MRILEPSHLDLLKECGYTYNLDWPLDDQPIWLHTRAGPLLSVPYPLELNDTLVISRDHTGEDFATIVLDQFEEMLGQAGPQPLVFSIALHTFVSGQPHRLRQLRRVLDAITAHREELWVTSPGAIAAHVVSEPRLGGTTSPDRHSGAQPLRVGK